MKRTTTRTIALLLTALLVLCSLPVMTAFASYENTYTNTGNQAADIVGVAATQIGYLEGSLSGTTAGSNNYTKYGVWYANKYESGSSAFSYGAWCAMFVSWCADQAGISTSIVPAHAYCPTGVNWFKNKGQWYLSASRGGSYTPKAGDIIYFASSDSTTASHVGIVRGCSNGTVYTYEGNTSGQNGEVNDGGGAFAKSYSLSYARIYGYGVPAYEDNSGHTVTFNSNGGSSVASQTVKDGGTVSYPTNPTKYGFEFAGWYCNPELTDAYNFSTPVPYDFTLYAKWNEAYWSAMSSLMPVSGQLQFNAYNDAGDTVWPYYASEGYVDLYSAVEGYAWPSAYMTYENSIDSANDAYIYVKKDGTAKFNAVITYLDADAVAHDVTLSELAGRGSEDFDAGYQEFFVNFGMYVYQQGHLTETGNVKIVKCTYYVIGEKDSWVKLYDMKFTPAFDIDDPYVTLYSGYDVITQSGKFGSYSYDNGVLSMQTEAADGYSVSFNTSTVIAPSDMINLIMNINSTAPFNVTLTLTGNKGTMDMELRREFFTAFGYSSLPESLPAGNWDVIMDIAGYFDWNGGAVDSSTVQKVTITLVSPGSLTLSALQVSRINSVQLVQDSAYTSGSIDKPAAPTALTSSTLTVGSNTVSRVAQGMTVSALFNAFNEKDYVHVFDASGTELLTGTVKTGMTVQIRDGSTVIKSYTLSVVGDVDGDGETGSSDARLIMVALLNNNVSLSGAAALSADVNNDGTIDTSDARLLLAAASR